MTKKKPLHIKWRKKIKNALNTLLRTLSPYKGQKAPIDPAEIKNILVIRINYRIGNILFTTPLLNALEQQFPDSKIDMLIGAAYPAPLLKGFKNIGNIFDFPRKLLKNPLDAWRYIQNLRTTHYDLIININGHSASDRAATLLTRGTYKLGFHLPNQWAPTTHVVETPETKIHEAQKPLYFMRAFGREPSEFKPYLDIALSDAEKAQGLSELEQRLNTQGCASTQGKTRIALFRDARYEKKIANDWWQELVSQLQKTHPDAVFMDILSPDVPEKLNANIYALSESNLRMLGMMLSQLDLFICGDTGPMHLASAAKAPTIALFKASNPKLYGPMGEQDCALSISDSTLIEVAERISQHLAATRTAKI